MSPADAGLLSACGEMSCSLDLSKEALLTNDGSNTSGTKIPPATGVVNLNETLSADESFANFLMAGSIAGAGFDKLPSS